MGIGEADSLSRSEKQHVRQGIFHYRINIVVRYLVFRIRGREMGITYLTQVVRIV